MTLSFFTPPLLLMDMIIQGTLSKFMWKLDLLRLNLTLVSFSFFFFKTHIYPSDSVHLTILSTVNIVDLTYKEEKELRSRDVLLESGFVYVLGITSATGMPVELCSDEDLESGKCERGEEYSYPVIFYFPHFFSFLGSGLPIDSWTDFMTTRTISSLNVVDNLNCNVIFPFPPL